MTSIHKNSSSVLISSNKPLQEIESLFRKNFPDREVVINDKISINFDDNSDKNNNNIITLTNMNNLHRDIADKDTKIIDMEVNALKTTEAINAFYRQQQALFDEFVILRKKYDDLKNTMHKTLWNHCLPYHPDFRHIPPLDSNLTEDEEKGLYGNYTTAELIGEGQFATVRACTRPTHLSVHSGNQTRGRSLSHSSLSRRPSGEPTTLPSTSLSAKSKATPPILTTKEVDGNTSIQDPMAIKLIKKSKITSIHFMHRLASEVDTLHRLRDSEHVIRLLDSFQTPSHVCLVTERGGKDLFELLRAHTEGLPEAWVRSISVELIRGVTFCHRNGICHRDIKPENILVSLDVTTGACLQLKLCDFGLSCRFQPTEVLVDFCGSPGFFDPDMLIERNYFGDKADAWSVGAVLLEAVLGPDRFGRLWMPAYGYDVLQDRNAFQTAITRTCSSLPLAMPFADELNDFLLGLLSVDSFTRTALHPHAGQHIWIKDQMKAANEAESLGSPAVGGGGGRVSLRFDIPDEPLDDARLSARRLADNDKDPLVSVLPPIFPPAKTPCIVSARKIMFPRDGVNSNESSSSRKQFD